MHYQQKQEKSRERQENWYFWTLYVWENCYKQDKKTIINIFLQNVFHSYFLNQK